MAATGSGTTAPDAPRVLGISSGERLGLIATIDDPHAIRETLAHLGLPTEVPHPDPPRPPSAEPPHLLADILA